MKYMNLVSLVFLSIVVCTNSMEDQPKRKNSNIKITLPRRISNDKKEEMLKNSPRSDINLPVSEARNPLLFKKSEKCS